MSKASRQAQRPIEEVAAARAFYAGIGQDVRYFSALWHTFSVGHMLTNDLDRICRQFGLSIADFYLMGALRIDRPQPLRATDLAVTLQVSNGALTARVVKLGGKGLLTKQPVPGDARAFTLHLSSDGGCHSRSDPFGCCARIAFRPRARTPAGMAAPRMPSRPTG
jgi:hypothetical protein